MHHWQEFSECLSIHCLLLSLQCCSLCQTNAGYSPGLVVSLSSCQHSLTNNHSLSYSETEFIFMCIYLVCNRKPGYNERTQSGQYKLEIVGESLSVNLRHWDQTRDLHAVCQQTTPLHRHFTLDKSRVFKKDTSSSASFFFYYYFFNLTEKHQNKMKWAWELTASYMCTASTVLPYQSWKNNVAVLK